MGTDPDRDGVPDPYGEADPHVGADPDRRAPICPSCGVTALPADAAHVVDTRFVCENPDCDAFGDEI